MSRLPCSVRRTVALHGLAGAAALASGAWLLPATGRAGGAFPSRPVTLVVPNAPGGPVDMFARVLEPALQQAWGQPVQVVYKPGAGTVVGTDHVAKSRPADGHVLGFVVTSHVINPSMRKRMPFDTLNDLAPVSLLATAPVLLSARRGLPVDNLPELIAWARERPGTLTYASPGAGSSMHLAGELLKSLAGIDMLHVPFNGSAPALTELTAGRVDLLIDALFSSLPHVRAGHLKPLAVVGRQRAAALPDVPAGADALPGFEVQSVYGVVAPAGTPAATVRRINADLVAAMRTPAVQARLDELGLAPLGSSPESFDAFIRSEIARWARIVKASGATID